MPEKIPTWMEGKSLDLLVETYSNAVRTVQVRGFTENEQIVADHLTTSDRALTSMVHPLSRPPIYLTIRTAETSVSRGECYVKVSLRLEGVVVALLMSGYVTDAGAQAFPNGKIESSVDGPGLIRSITGTNPAAGAEISETVPTGARWRFKSGRFSLVTDATAVIRTVQVTFDDGVNSYLRISPSNTQVNSSTRNYNISELGSSGATINAELAPGLPTENLLPAGFGIKTVTINLQAGDDYGALQYLVEEWIEP